MNGDMESATWIGKKLETASMVIDGGFPPCVSLVLF